jgi:hypothetical protein
MMLAGQIGQTARFVREEVLSRRGPAHFWSERFLPRWLPLLLGVAFAVLVSVLIAQGLWQIAVVAAMLVPVAVALFRYPFGVVLLWLLVLPFFVEGTSSISVLLNWGLNRFLIPVALVLTVLKDWLGLRQRPAVRFGVAEFILLAFFVSTLANVLLVSVDTYRSLVKFYDLMVIPLALYLLVRLSDPDERDLKRLIGIGFFVVVAESTIGILSWVAPGVLPGDWSNLAGARATGSFNGPASYTTLLVFFACLLTHRASLPASRLLRLAATLAIGMAALGVFVSFSRGSWLGCALAMLGLLLVYPRVLAPLLAVSLTAFALLGSTILSGYMGLAWERLNTESTAEGRLISTMASVRMIEARPVFGWGFGDRDLYDDQFRTRVLNVEINDTTSHNSYLSIMSELGLVGFLIYAFPPVYWLAQSARAWRRLPAAGLFSRLLLIALWLALLHNFVVNNLMDMVRHQPFGTGLWWLSLALVANLVHRSRAAESSSALASERPGERIGQNRELHQVGSE